MRQELRLWLRKMGDLERLGGRTWLREARCPERSRRHPSDPKSRGRRLAQRARPLQLDDLEGAARNDLAELPEVVALIESAIVDAPPLSVKEGGFIRAGFDAELDEIRGFGAHAKEWIAHFEAGRAAAHRHPFA